MARHPCAQPGCPVLVKGRHPRCPEHETKRMRQDVQERGSSKARGYGGDWRRLRDLHYQQHPLCEACQRGGMQVAAQVVDHIVPHRGDEALRLDPANLQSLCWSCHRRKTALEGGGYRATLSQA